MAPTPGTIRHWLRGISGGNGSGTADCEGDLVLPRDNPQKRPISPSTPTVFSIEVTAQEQSPLGGETRALLGIKNIHLSSEIQKPTNLRWMHFPGQDVEFETFLRWALKAYGLVEEAEVTVVLKSLSRLQSSFERPSFQGRRFREGVRASEQVQLPGQEEKVGITFMAIPYFLLAKPEKKARPNRSKVHWVQPLVQSAYHLDSSISRENQQAIRRLHHHIAEVLHVPQLWLLNIGNKFIATSSPTPLFDDPISSITTRMLGGNSFPSIIRVTMSSGFIFCLQRAQCRVWFTEEFISRVRHTVKAALNSPINDQDFVYRLQEDGSEVQGNRWPLILLAHPPNEPLLIQVSPGERRSSQRPPIALPLEGKYFGGSDSNDFTSCSGDKMKLLSPETLDEYKLPYYWDYPEAGDPALIIDQKVSELDLKILYDHTRRLRATADRYEYAHHMDLLEFDDTFYVPPPFVLDAARSQPKGADTVSQGIQPSKQPIFKWPIKDDTGDTDTTPTQRMRALVAHMHHEILFSSRIDSAIHYNNLPLKGRADIESEMKDLRDIHHLNGHLHALTHSFVRSVSLIIQCFIDSNFDCIVKGKILAAVHLIIQTLKSPASDSLFAFQCDVFSIPLHGIRTRIQALRDGLVGATEFYITDSMVKAFVELVLLLVDSSSEASRLMQDNEGHDEPNENGHSDADASSLEYERRGRSPPARLDTEPGNSRDWRESEESPRVDRHHRYSGFDRSRTGSSELYRSESESRRGKRRARGDPSFRVRQNTNTSFDDLNYHVERIFEYVNHAQDECSAMFQPEDSQDKSSYDGVDCGRIMSLVMESVMRGHSASQSMPTLDTKEIYATYTTSLQLQARTRPSKNLLIDMNLLREELEIIADNNSQQLRLINGLCKSATYDDESSDSGYMNDTTGVIALESITSPTSSEDGVVNMPTREILSRIKDDLEEKRDVFDELINRVDRLEKQIYQRADIMQEDHGKAILIFTIVSVIFLPLSFVSSYLGMNTVDIRDMDLTQALFWQSAVPLTVVIVSIVLVVAYNANRLLAWLPLTPAVP